MPSGSFGLFVDAVLTIECPHTPTLTVPTRVVALTGSGPLSAQSTQFTGTGFSFTRVVGSPSAAAMSAPMRVERN